jgi:hypothetical protein
MKFAKSILMGTGAVVLAGLILTLVAPKAAHAIVATAVSVVNTSSNPVPVSSIDGPGRVPFVESESFINCPGTSTCQSAFTTPVPAGHRVVITYVSAWMRFGTFPTAILGTLNATVPTVGDFLFNVPVAPFIVDRQYFAAPVVFYFDAGQIPQLVFLTNGTFLADNPSVGHGITEVTLFGYELDCSVAPCPAIATQ